MHLTVKNIKYFLLITEKSLGNIYSFLFSKQLSYSTILTIIIKKFKRYKTNGNFGIECYAEITLKNRKSNASFGFPFHTCEVLAEEEKSITVT